MQIKFLYHFGNRLTVKLLRVKERLLFEIGFGNFCSIIRISKVLNQRVFRKHKHVVNKQTVGNYQCKQVYVLYGDGRLYPSVYLQDQYFYTTTAKSKRWVILQTVCV